MHYVLFDPSTGEVWLDQTGQPQLFRAQRFPNAPELTSQMPFIIPQQGVVNPPPPHADPKMRAIAQCITRNVGGYAEAVWGFLPDHRGECWYTVHGAAVEIKALGHPSAMGLLPSNPKPRRGFRRIAAADGSPPGVLGQLLASAARWSSGISSMIQGQMHKKANANAKGKF